MMTPHASRTSVIERAALIMQAFDSSREHLLLDDLVTHTGLPRSTVFRLAMQLVDVGWLERDEALQGFRIGNAVRKFADPETKYASLRETAHPELFHLHERTKFTAHLSVLEEDGMIYYVDIIQELARDTLISRVGQRYPFERTAAGKAIIAGLDQEQAERHLINRERARGVFLDGVRRELPIIRRNHCIASRIGATSRQNVFAIAAPVYGPHGAVGAISLASHSSLYRQLVPAMLEAAYRITETLYPGLMRVKRSVSVH